MSILQYPETATTTQLQVWNNAAFDNAADEQPPQGKGGGFSFPMKASWSSLHSSESLRSSDCSKENMSPAALNNSSSISSVPSKPLLLHSTAENKTKKSFEDDDDDRGEDEKMKKNNIDDEIREIENEIKRLSSRLEALRLQKAAEAAVKMSERRGRIVPAKFMEQKPSSAAKKVTEEETTPIAVKVPGLMRRGVSLGPAEILSSAGGGGRFSRWPAKVSAVNGMMITPVPTQSTRRKSCFWKLEDVDEMRGGVGERKKKTTLSLSPKTKRNVKQAATAATVSVASRKSVKKEDGGVAAALVQPRKLFKEGEKSVPSKKPAAKAGRVVASRYNQIGSGGGDVRKRSLSLENDKNDEVGKRHASLRGNGQGSEVRMKKRWEIPSAQVEVEEEKPLVVLPPSSNANMSRDMLLPKIRTLRYLNESPRDSGAAKRVADLTGKRSYFYCPDEEDDMEVCHVLNFAEDADE